MPSPSRYYSSNAAKTTLADSISSSATSLTLSAASNLPAQYPYTLILEKDTANEEVIEVTSLVGSSYQITRNIDSSGAKAHAVGANVEHGVSARDFTESRAHEVATTGVHGISGDVVGTSGAQTLASKTLTTPTINGATISGTFTSTATISGGTITGASITGLAEPTTASSAATRNYIDTQTTSAAASATAAATSASSASTSATSAATSASSASTSAASALTSATSAATSASSASTSASSAATSASAAATSASNASASATLANDWATKTSGTVAGGEYSAKYHAQAAAASATSASTSASSAATSATSAATSASSASTSASSALTSANSAATSASSAATSAAQIGSALLATSFNAKGDIFVASANDTAAVLSVGADGYLLTASSTATNGITWAAAPVSLPSQTGNGGKYLTTNGSSASWGAITTDPNPSIFMLMGA